MTELNGDFTAEPFFFKAANGAFMPEATEKAIHEKAEHFHWSH